MKPIEASKLNRTWTRLKKWMRERLFENGLVAKIGWIVTFCFYMIAIFALFILIIWIACRIFPEITSDSTRESVTNPLIELIGGGAIASLLGTVFLVIQLRRENCSDYQRNLIQQCEHLMEYNQSFITNKDIAAVESLLEKYFDKYKGWKNGEVDKKDICATERSIKRKWQKIGSEGRQKLINYLVYLEGFSSSVLNHAMTFDVVDNLFAYRYFIAVNNPIVQELELVPSYEYYKGIFKLYKKWIEYYREKCKSGDIIIKEDPSEYKYGYLKIPMHMDNVALCEKEQFGKINGLDIDEDWKEKWKAKACFYIK